MFPWKGAPQYRRTDLVDDTIAETPANEKPVDAPHGLLAAFDALEPSPRERFGDLALAFGRKRLPNLRFDDLIAHAGLAELFSDAVLTARPPCHRIMDKMRREATIVKIALTPESVDDPVNNLRRHYSLSPESAAYLVFRAVPRREQPVRKRHTRCPRAGPRELFEVIPVNLGALLDEPFARWIPEHEKVPPG